MTVQDLNSLQYVSLNLERVMQKLEAISMLPSFFLPFDADQTPKDPLATVLQCELDELMSKYRQVVSYIDGISDPWMKDVFVARFIGRKSFREIGTKYSFASGTLKQEVYAYIRLNPEGYISCKDLAERWNLNINTINNYCRNGLLSGAKKRGRQRWIIPADVKRPVSTQSYQPPDVPTGYITAKELARLRGVTPAWISKRCRNGEFFGSTQIDRKMWVIPEKYAFK